MAKRLHDEEVEQAAAREKQEKYDFEKAKVLQQQKPIFIAQARKNMIVYLKNMDGYKMTHFRGMTYEQVRPIFEREYNKVQTLFIHDKDVEEPSKKRVAEETLLQESFKKLKAVKVLGSHSTQDTPNHDPKEMSEEDVKNMLEIVPVSVFKVEALQVKYPLIDWEIHSEGSRSYWKIIRVDGITEAYQSFEDMLKGFDREDLDALWRLVKEKFSSAVPTEDKEKALWVELKRLYEPMQMIHDIIFTKKDYPLTDAVMILMLSAKLRVDEDCEMARDLVMKIFMEANKPKSKRRRRRVEPETKITIIGHFLTMKLKTESPRKVAVRDKTSGSSSFNTESVEASINLNVNVGDDEEDEVKEIRRPISRDKTKGSMKKKGPRSSGSSSTNDEALDRLMVSELAMYNERAIKMQKEEHKAFLDIKMREVECRE
nr:hypothetical protein [Tanacetum cinerariifolium]